MSLQIQEFAPQAGVVVLEVSGRLNAISAPELKAGLTAALGAGQPTLILDLAGVTFIDSSGLSALVAGLKAAREAGGTLRLAGLREDVRTIFSLTLLDRVFEFYPHAAAALGQPDGTGN